MAERWIPRDYIRDRSSRYSLHNPVLTDDAFTPGGFGEFLEVNILDEFDDIENAERDAVDSVQRRYRRAPMLDEALD